MLFANVIVQITSKPGNVDLISIDVTPSNLKREDKHQISHHIHVVAVLKRESKSTEERMIELFENGTFSKDISHSIHFNAFFFVDVFERI